MATNPTDRRTAISTRRFSRMPLRRRNGNSSQGQPLTRDAVKYEIHCEVELEGFYHLANLYTAVCELAKEGRATASFRCTRRRRATDPSTVSMRVRNPATGASLRVAFEMSDRSDVFNLEALENCDIYFKRSYYVPDLEPLSARLREKIMPGGLNFACRTPSSSRRLLPLLIPLYGSRAIASPRSVLRNLGLHRRILASFIRSPLFSDFQNPPDGGVERVILFQTRVWDPADIQPDIAEEVNGRRVQVVRALKAEFGPLFRGGLVPDAYACKHYPDAVTAEPSRRDLFIARSKRALIGIYTRGLHHSLAFKLPEYLASSKCIVSEPLRNQLADPLMPGLNYLEFDSIGKCVENCARLLADKDLVERMRQSNWEYYRAHVYPSGNLANCLDRALLKESCRLCAMERLA